MNIVPYIISQAKRQVQKENPDVTEIVFYYNMENKVLSVNYYDGENLLDKKDVSESEASMIKKIFINKFVKFRPESKGLTIQMDFEKKTLEIKSFISEKEYEILDIEKLK